MIYFDNAASAPLLPEVLELMKEELELFANPSSLHRLGFEAEKRMKLARAKIAACLSAREDEIVFTSGGTEADNLALLGAAVKMNRRGNHIISTDSEHPAVEEVLKKLESDGFCVTRLSTRGGKIDLGEAAEEIREKTVLVAVMRTNNETGAVYDLKSLSALAKKKNPQCLVFSDAVQAFGKTPFIPSQLGLDMASLSSHKIGGPKGVGALYVKKGLMLPPLILGGGQEKGVRSGTENLPGIIAFGEAAKRSVENLKENTLRMEEIRRRILTGLESEKRVCVNLPQNPSPHVLSLQVHPFRSEVLLHMLSEKGIFVSSGSACSSHKGKSPVLRSFGLTEKERDCTIRLSFSGQNTPEEGDEFVRVLKEILA